MVKLEMFRFEANEAAQIPAGTVVFKEGDAGHALFVILEGSVSVSVQGVMMEQMGPGELFGEMALIDDEPRSATVTAVTDCKLAEIGEKRFNFLVQQHPRFALQLMRIMADRLRRATRARAPT